MSVDAPIARTHRVEVEANDHARDMEPHSLSTTPSSALSPAMGRQPTYTWAGCRGCPQAGADVPRLGASMALPLGAGSLVSRLLIAFWSGCSATLAPARYRASSVPAALHPAAPIRDEPQPTGSVEFRPTRTGLKMLDS